MRPSPLTRGLVTSTHGLALASHASLFPSLQGLVKVDAFVSRESGELMVIEVDHAPQLTADCPIFQQVGGVPLGWCWVGGGVGGEASLWLPTAPSSSRWGSAGLPSCLLLCLPDFFPLLEALAIRIGGLHSPL